MNDLYHDDNMNVLKTLQNGSVDFVFTDPPYNVGKDYGTYKDNLSDEEYLSKTSEWIDELKRISNDRMCVYVPTKYKLDYWNMLGHTYKEIILSYSPEGAFRYGFVNQFSSMLTNVKPVQRTKNVWHNTQIPGLGYFFREDNFGHPGYTSLDITKRVLLAFTVEEQIVLDPFAGTGTTGVACAMLGRKFIGIEIDDKYYAIAQKRIELAHMQIRMAL